MSTAEDAIALIKSAWNHEIEPLGTSVTRSPLDEENLALVKAFGDVRDWRALSAEFLDDAPDGWATALNFFSDEAIQYFIAGYLVADLEGKLQRSEPMFHLTNGFDHAAYGSWEGPDPERAARWHGLSRQKAEAVVAYLKAKCLGEGIWDDQASAALDSYWNPRLRELQ